MVVDRKYLNLGTYLLDGEHFLLTVPTVHQWCTILRYMGEEALTENRWHNNCQIYGANEVFCQSIAGQFTNPDLVRMPFSMLEYKKTGWPHESSLSKAYEGVGFVPMLIPLKNPRVTIYDNTSSQFTQDMDSSDAFTFMVNGRPQVLGDVVVPSLKGARKKRLKFWFSDTIPNSTERHKLSWVHVDGGYVCLSCLARDFSYLDIATGFAQSGQGQNHLETHIELRSGYVTLDGGRAVC